MRNNTRHTLIAVLPSIVLLLIAMAGCFNRAARNDGQASADLIVGMVQGTITGCEQQPLVGARIDLSRMPDSLVQTWLTDTARTLYSPEYFGTTGFVDSTRTDTAGRYTFEDVTEGYYQVWLHLSTDLSYCPDYRLAGTAYRQVDFIRVAPDSISVAGWSAQPDPAPKFAAVWLPIIKPSNWEGRMNEGNSR